MERKTSFNNQDAVMDFVETEIEVTRNANNLQHLKMLEEMEKALKKEEGEKDLLLQEVEALWEQLSRITESNKNNVREKKQFQDQV